ncbi:hypothetical protein COS81_01190, partial [candidate division WWE3 bacterium CG06_land_8_20_14_3_00_42_16]
MFQNRGSQFFKIKFSQRGIFFLSSVLFFCILSLSSFIFIKIKAQPDKPLQSKPDIKDVQVGMADPAAVYCQTMGYQHQVITEVDGSQHGICIFSDRASCPAWDFLAGKCEPNFSFCAKEGYDIKTVKNGKDPLSLNYAVCVSKEDGKIVGSVTDLTGLVEKSIKVKQPSQNQVKTQKVPVGSEIATLSDTPPRLPAEKNTSQSEILGGFQAVPTSFDWRNYKSGNWTTPVKDQGGCGACWSFSAVGVAEAAYNIAAKNPAYDLNLSEQYHVAGCDSPPGCAGCCGGWNNVALEEIRDHGIPDDSCLPFVDNSGCSCDGGVGGNECCNVGNGPCSATCNYYTTNCSDKTCSNRCSDWASRLTTIKSVGTIADNGETADRAAMKKYLLEKGPLSIAFDATEAGDPYGIYWYYDETHEHIVYYCGSSDEGLTANHAVVITGYNDNHGFDGYWIVKNSWGNDWGWKGDGYLNIVYGSCLVEKSGVYYAEAGTPEWAVKNSSGVDVASINALGTMVLKGTCSAGSACTAPANSFIVQNATGETVGYVDSNGNLCVETGTCADL